MKIYHYHPRTGEYLGVGEADESPLEKGKYLIPANATTEEPPALNKGEVAKRKDNTWIKEIMPEPIEPKTEADTRITLYEYSGLTDKDKDQLLFEVAKKVGLAK